MPYVIISYIDIAANKAPQIYTAGEIFSLHGLTQPRDVSVMGRSFSLWIMDCAYYRGTSFLCGPSSVAAAATAAAAADDDDDDDGAADKVYMTVILKIYECDGMIMVIVVLLVLKLVW